MRLIELIQSGFLALVGLAVALVMMTTDKGVDTLALYSFEHAIPDTNILDKAHADNPKAATTSEISQAALQKSNFPKQCNPALYGQQVWRSPACKCVYHVLLNYSIASTAKPFTGWNNASLDGRYTNASQAVQACFSSQELVPQMNFMWKDQYDINNIKTRKVVSRGGLVLVLALSVIFTMIYNNIDFSKWGTSEIIASNVGLGIIVLVQIMAAGAGGVNYSGITSISAILVAPAVVFEFILVEFGLSYTYGRRRTLFAHPYVFATTLSVLFIMAAIENGVFSWNEIFSRVLTAHTLALAYAASIFFVTFGCGDWEKDGSVYKQQSEFIDMSSMDGQTLAGHFLLGATVSYIAISQIIPLYPTVPDLNLMWAAPWVYVLISFGTILIAEQVSKGNRDGEKRLHAVSYMGSLAGILFLGTVFTFYIIRIHHLGFGDTILSNSGGVLSSINYAWDVRGTSFPLGGSTPLYVVP